MSLGEGTTSEGEFWESLNTACRLHLPVLYVVADNGYAISVRSADQAPAPVSRAGAGVPGPGRHRRWTAGTTRACRQQGGRAMARVRAGEGPGLIHAHVTRPYSHSAADSQAKYRDADELAEEQAHDPIDTFERGPGERRRAHRRPGARPSGPRPSRGGPGGRGGAGRRRDPIPATVTDHVVPSRSTARPERRARRRSDPAADGGGASLCVMAEAIRLTLHELLAGDERIRVFGEDVADADDDVLDDVEGKGGVFGVTRGLQRRFGSARCYNTPLAESNIIGRGVGQALRGLRPCAEIQFFDYIWPAMQQLRSEAATIRWRSNGAFTLSAGGAGGHRRLPDGGRDLALAERGVDLRPHPRAARWRSLRGRATPWDCCGRAFAAEDPVLFLEHKHLYRQRYAADPFPETGMDGALRSRRRGPRRDATSPSSPGGPPSQKSLVAAERAGRRRVPGRGRRPADHLAVGPRARVRVGRAHRAGSLVVHEDTLTAGFGAEVAAWVAEHCFWALDAPVTRVAAVDTFVAYEPSLEQAILPQVSDITAAARAVAELTGGRPRGTACPGLSS